MHEYDQVKRDINNSLNYINDGGVVFVHDCMPRSFFEQAVPRSQHVWTGDVWKSIVELRTRDRERKLINKIDAALQRIEDGSYGYCDETGDPISIKRLEARPVATLSLEAQEMHEKFEKIYKEKEY